MAEDLEIQGLDGEEIWAKIYNKELNTKKNILEYIEMTKAIKDTGDIYQIESTYNFIYKNIDKMAQNIKPNTIMYLKNALKSKLGKYVTIKDPKIESTFIEFFKEAYPEGERRKDFTWVLMDINKIVPEQIWHTLTYINRECMNYDLELSNEEKDDIIEMVEKLISKNDLKYVNNMKSLEVLNIILNIKIVETKNGFKVKRLNK